MKKTLFAILIVTMACSVSAKIHTIKVWDGYFQFMPNNLTIALGDTIQWVPLDKPSMVHTITSKKIPTGADAFDKTWQAPADTFFQYIPKVTGVYDYVCTPHEFNFNMVGSFTVTDGTNSAQWPLKDLNYISIYPIPAKDKLFIKGIPENTEFLVLNILGELVLKGVVQKEPVDVSTLGSGVYYFKSKADNSLLLKFIKED